MKRISSSSHILVFGSMTRGFSNIVLVDFFIVEEDDIGSAAIYMLSIYLSFHLCISLSIYLSIYLFIFPSIYHTYLSRCCGGDKFDTGYQDWRSATIGNHPSKKNFKNCVKLFGLAPEKILVKDDLAAE